jgi:hypothetical protein
MRHTDSKCKFSESLRFIPSILRHGSATKILGIFNIYLASAVSPISDSGSRIQMVKKAPDPGTGSATLVKNWRKLFLIF